MADFSSRVAALRQKQYTGEVQLDEAALPNEWREAMREYNARLENAALEALTPERFEVIWSTMTGQSTKSGAND